MNPTFEVKIKTRTRRFRRAQRLLRILGMARRLIARRAFVAAVRYVVCRVLIIEMQIDGARWRRIRIQPDEVLVA